MNTLKKRKHSTGQKHGRVEEQFFFKNDTKTQKRKRGATARSRQMLGGLRAAGWSSQRGQEVWEGGTHREGGGFMPPLPVTPGLQGGRKGMFENIQRGTDDNKHPSRTGKMADKPHWVNVLSATPRAQTIVSSSFIRQPLRHKT